MEKNGGVMKFNTVTQGKNGMEFTSVEGRFVKLDGFPDLRFFYYKDDKYYSVCELTTGRRVVGGFKLKDAKQRAVEVLGLMGAVETGRIIQESLAELGRVNDN